MVDQLHPTSALRSSIESTAGPLAALIASPSSDNATAPVLLLVPGYTGSKEDFAPILDPLARPGFVAIAVDLPGQFESPGPDDEADYRPTVLGPVIASVASRFALDHPVVLLGHSFGGLVCREAVLAGADTVGLVLLCSGPGALIDGNRYDALMSSSAVLRAEGQTALYDRIAVAAGLDPHDPAPLAQFFRRRFLASSQAALLGMGSALLTEPDRTPALAAALAARYLPVAVMAGEADDAWPLPVQAKMATALGTSLMLVPGAHSPAVEAPDDLVAALLPLLNSWVDAAGSPTGPRGRRAAR